MPSARLSLPLPTLTDMGEIARVDHTRLRRRLLYSEHEADLVQRVRKNIGSVRRAAWGHVDLTANPYLTMWTNAAALYDEAPDVNAPDAAEMLDQVADVGFWAQQQRVQRDTLALREMLVRVDVDEDGDISFRPVFPDMVTLRAHPRRPSVPIGVVEHIYDETLDAWLRHDIDVREPARPVYVVHDSDGKDVTGDVLGETYTGKDYPYRRADGTPIVPYGLYHAAETGCLFDPFTYREIVEGSLNIGVLLTFYGHLVRNAAWAQRYAVNLEPIGMEATGELGERSRRRQIVTDPATLLLLKRINDATEGQVGQWSAPGDPEAVLRSISMYERRIQLIAGFTPPEVTRQEADIRSGYSLAVDREALRERQRVFLPQFRRGDRQVLSIAAALLNRVRGTSYPEDGAAYRVVYQGLPESPAEQRNRLESVTKRRDAGLIGPVTALRELRPELSHEEALAELVKVSTEKAELDAAVAGDLAARGIDTPPPVVQIEVGTMQAAAAMVEAAQAGRVPVESVRAMLIAMGFPGDQADAITKPIRPITQEAA